MSSLFPGAIPSYSTMDPNLTTKVSGHTARHNSYQDDIVALATKVGTSSSIDTSSIDYRLSSVSGGDKAASRSGAETLANKTINGSALNSPTISGTVSGGATYSSVILPTPSITNPSITGGGSWTGSPTLDKPTINDLTNMQHNHSSATKGGGNIPISALTPAIGYATGGTGTITSGSSNTDFTIATLIFTAPTGGISTLAVWLAARIQQNTSMQNTFKLTLDGVVQTLPDKNQIRGSIGSTTFSAYATIATISNVSAGSHTLVFSSQDTSTGGGNSDISGEIFVQGFNA